MNLSLYKKDVFEKYKSGAQLARVLTENWFEREMYCPSCLNENLTKNPDNTKVVDFTCSNCENDFQLKAQSKPLKSRVVDGALKPMLEYIKKRVNPNFSFMHYSTVDWLVQNLIVIPKFFFSESIIEKRKPLSMNARRSGWVGCNIVLSNLSNFGKIKVIENKETIPQRIVQKNWRELSFLNKESIKKRAWVSDILSCIEKLGKKEFNLEELYNFEKYLSRLHPNNYHVKPKIRQQLQFLRERGILKFKKKGNYKIMNLLKSSI